MRKGKWATIREEGSSRSRTGQAGEVQETHFKSSGAGKGEVGEGMCSLILDGTSPATYKYTH